MTECLLSQEGTRALLCFDSTRLHATRFLNMDIMSSHNAIMFNFDTYLDGRNMPPLEGCIQDYGDTCEPRIESSSFKPTSWFSIPPMRLGFQTLNVPVV